MLGKRLREFRKKKGLTLVELAAKINISHGSLSEIETGKTKPSADTITSLSRHTNINIDWLLKGEGPMLRPDVLTITPVPRTAEMILKDQSLGYGPTPTEIDDVTNKILILLKDMDEEKRRDILKYTEKEKLLSELIEERKKKQG